MRLAFSFAVAIAKLKELKWENATLRCKSVRLLVKSFWFKPYPFFKNRKVYFSEFPYSVKLCRVTLDNFYLYFSELPF